MEKDIIIEEHGRGGIVLYQSPDGQTRLDVKLENETVWLTQDQLVTLFQRDKSVISRHIKNIFAEGELDENVVVAKNATTTLHGAISVPHLGQFRPERLPRQRLCRPQQPASGAI